MPDRLIFQIPPSRTHTFVSTAVHVIALLSLWLARLPMAVGIPATILILTNLAVAVRKPDGSVRPSAGLAIEFCEAGVVALQQRNAEWRKYRLDGSTFVSSLVAVVNLSQANSSRMTSILVTAGTLDPTLFRRLRVWLKWRRVSNFEASSVSDTH